MINHHPKIITNGLILNLDAGNKKSYTGSGSSWVDLTKNKYNFTLYNTPTYSSSNNGFLTFAKSNSQYADYATSFQSLSSWTAEVWVNFTTTPASSSNVTALITGNYNLINNLNFCIGTTNSPTDYTIRAGFYNGAWRQTSGHTPTAGVWYSYSGTYNGSNIILYVNGVLFNSTAYTGTSQSGGGIRIARRWDDTLTASNLVDGAIPTARLYNRALTASEILQNYNATKGRFGL
jgi:hypothetical protein